MFGKLGILATILVLVLLFYFVISLGAGAFSKGKIKPETKRYLKSVNILLKYLNFSFYGDIVFKKFSEILFGLFSVCISSSKETQENLNLLKAKKVKYYGNIKFCSDIQIDKKINDHQFDKIKNKKVWCAVSTHDDEELFCSKIKLKIS